MESISTYQIVFSCLYAIALILTIFGNFLVMLAFTVDTRIRTPSNFLLASLSFTDFLIGVVYYPQYIAFDLSQPFLVHKWCFLWQISTVVLCTVSSFHLVIIAIHRYLILQKGIRYIQKRNLKGTVLFPISVASFFTRSKP